MKTPFWKRFNCLFGIHDWVETNSWDGKVRKTLLPIVCCKCSAEQYRNPHDCDGLSVYTPPWYKRLAGRCHKKEIGDAKIEEPYMIRHRIFNLWIIGAMLHEIRRGDSTRDYHDHRWAFFHVILEGEYTETYMYDKDSYGVLKQQKIRHLGYFAIHRPSYAHNIILHLDGKGEYKTVWTLVIHGPPVKDWGFVNYLTGKWTQWEEYLANSKQKGT